MIAPPRPVGESLVRILDDIVHEPGPAPGLRVEPGPAPSGASRPRILIADDEPMMREAVRELLEDLGFEVVGAASDGLAAVVLAGELGPDVVLMDLRMPALDGVEATRQIRSTHPNVHVVLLSAYDDPAFRNAAGQAGACAYLAKGCSPEVLEQVLRSAARHDRDHATDPGHDTLVVPDADDGAEA